MISALLDGYIHKYANEYGLPVDLIAGIVMTESSGRLEASRYEPKYRYMVNAVTGKPFRRLALSEIDTKVPPKDFPGLPGITVSAEEWIGQKISHGPMQIMGAVAREIGFKGIWDQLNGQEGVHYGAKHLRNYYHRYLSSDGLDGVISAYNCGQPKPTSNPDYVRKVHDFARQYRCGGLK